MYAESMLISCGVVQLMQRVRAQDAQNLLSADTLKSTEACISSIIDEMVLEDAPIGRNVRSLLTNHRHNIFGQDIMFSCDLPDPDAMWGEFNECFIAKVPSYEMKTKQLEMVKCIDLDSWKHMDEVAKPSSWVCTDLVMHDDCMCRVARAKLCRRDKSLAIGRYGSVYLAGSTI